MKKENRLEKIMKELILLGDFSPGLKQEISLSRGLKVGILTTKNHRKIEISRKGVQPSMAEWCIVCGKAGIKGKITPMIIKKDKEVKMIRVFKKESFKR